MTSVNSHIIRNPTRIPVGQTGAALSLAPSTGTEP